MEAKFIEKTANADGTFNYWFEVDGKELGVTEGGENGGLIVDREGNEDWTLDHMFLWTWITDEHRATPAKN